MLRLLRPRASGVRRLPALLSLSCAVFVAGCSTDVKRFDAPLGLTETGKQPAAPSQSYSANPSRPIMDDGVSPGASAPYSAQGYNQQPYGAQGYGGARQDAGGIQVAALPPIESQPPASSYSPPSTSSPTLGNVPPLRGTTSSTATPVQTPYNPPAAAPIATAGGRTIDVKPGDTVYGLAQKYHVSANELMRVNNLTSPALKPGQKLQLPGTGAGTTAAVPSSKSAALRQSLSEPASAVAPSGWNGSYTVKTGDNVYGIARAHGTTAADLQHANNITDVRRLRPGDVLKVPAGASSETAAVRAPVAPAPIQSPASSSVADAGSVSAGGGSTGTARPKVLNAPQVATAEPQSTMSDAPRASDIAVTAAASASDKLRWPVRGRVIANYGTKTTGGRNNDGLNIAVPQGTDVLAAEAGTVTYAASELAEYGNLVVVRHDNGWVTAYAYNDQLLVQRGDRVKRGQPIAKAGKTGVAEQPQVHFELRQNGKPVDPMPFMDKG